MEHSDPEPSLRRGSEWIEGWPGRESGIRWPRSNAVPVTLRRLAAHIAAVCEFATPDGFASGVRIERVNRA